MFELSFGKMALIAVVALLVLGPERLPAAARTAGALLRRARNSWQSVRTEIERELAAEDVKRSLRDSGRELILPPKCGAAADIESAVNPVRRLRNLPIRRPMSPLIRPRTANSRSCPISSSCARPLAVAAVLATRRVDPVRQPPGGWLARFDTRRRRDDRHRRRPPFFAPLKLAFAAVF